jgi:hypothetical protein
VARLGATCRSGALVEVGFGWVVLADPEGKIRKAPSADLGIRARMS